MADILQMKCKAHKWGETWIIQYHTGQEVVEYVRCKRCGSIGFRRPPSHVVYTWEQDTSLKEAQ